MRHAKGEIVTLLTIAAMLVMTLGLLIGTQFVARRELTGTSSFAQQAPTISPNQANIDASWITMTFGPILNRNDNQKMTTGNICFKPESQNPPNSGAYYVKAYARIKGQGPIEVGSSVLMNILGQRNAFRCPTQKKYDLFTYRNLNNVPGLPAGATLADVESVVIHLETALGTWEPTMANPVATINNPASLFDKTPGGLPSTSPSPSVTTTVTPSVSPTVTTTVTPSPSVSVTPSVSPTVTITPSITLTPTVTTTITPSPSTTITPTPGPNSHRISVAIINGYTLPIVKASLTACANGVECLTSETEVNIPPRGRAIIYFNYNYESPTINFVLLGDLWIWLGTPLDTPQLNDNTIKKSLNLRIDGRENILLYINAGEGAIQSQAKTESQASDVSGDGCVNTNDAALLIPKLGTIEESLTSCSATDIDCNGFNNALDLSFIIDNLNMGFGCVYNQP